MSETTPTSTRQTFPACIIAAGLCALLLTTVVVGCCCKAPAPGGFPMQPRPLGGVVDQANRIQEDNAELAKLIVYAHEFELNKPRQEIDAPWTDDSAPQDGNPTQPRGFRLNEYGIDHLKGIAKFLLDNGAQPVIVERSETSKHWDTIYHYPVHFNAKLDEQRRQVVVAGLEALGVEQADEFVIVAPAYPEGQHSQEAAQGYQSLWGTSQAGGNSNTNAAGGSF